MRVTAHLFISRGGNIRINKTGTGVKPSEVAIKLDITIPDRFFTRPIPVARIEVPVEALINPTQDAVVAVTAAAVADALSLDVAAVTDGLRGLIADGDGGAS